MSDKLLDSLREFLVTELEDNDRLQRLVENFVDSSISDHLDNVDWSDHSSDHDYHNDERYSSYDHEHDNSVFEDKVDEYLGSFTLGANCGVQRAFERAVMTCCEAWLGEGMTDLVRPMIRAVVAEARLAQGRNVPEGSLIAVLARATSDLRDLRPAVVAIETAGETANGEVLRYTRI